MIFRTPIKFVSFVLLFVLINSISLTAQKKKFTYNQIFGMAGPRITKSLPTIRKWIDEENYLEYKSTDGSRTRSLIKVNASSGEEEVYLDYKLWNEQLPDGFDLARAVDNTEDYKFFLLEQKDDLYYLSVEDNVFKQLTFDEVEKNNPTLSPNGKFAAYTKNRDLYVYDVENENETRITSDASEVVYNGYSSWVYYEEIFGRISKYKAFWWSPDNSKLAYMRFDDTPVPEYMLYDSEGTHGEWEKARYPKAGDPLPYVKFGIADINTGNTVWADFQENADHMIMWPEWTIDSKNILVQWIPRSFDNLKIFKVDCANGTKKEVYDEKQSSWVEWFEDLYMFKNGSGFLVRSDKDGWRHLYYYDIEGKVISRLTEGEWTVNEIVFVDENNEVVYFEADKGESTEKQLFKVNLDGSEFTQLTEESGTHNCMVSPGGRFIIDRFSNITTPTKLFLLDDEGEMIKILGESKADIMDEYQLGKTELFRVATHDGYELPVKWVLPTDFDESNTYPIIFSVYGGPGSTGVTNSWSRFTSPHYYAQEGIIYAQMDHRGSGHFGKKGEALLHRNLGRVDMDDYIEIAEWISNQPFIDSNKIAITGGSYGGYAALMGITRGAGIFDYAVAELSVSDWRLYDNVYTERFMDRPSENPEGYDFGAVNTHADKYTGYVLMTHGMMDDNVHPQNTLQVMSKFQDLNKDFDVMLYPGARHGIGFPKFFHNMRNKMEFWFRQLLDRELDTEKD